MIEKLSLAGVLLVLWLLLSGHFEPLLLAFGIVSCLLVLFIAHRMDVVDHEGHPIRLGHRAIRYWPWLILQIAKSNWDVARRVLHPRLPISPTLVHVKASQKSDIGQVIYANSITLTPGTVTLDIESSMILVHALTSDGAAALGAGDMDRRVTAMEG